MEDPHPVVEAPVTVVAPPVTATGMPAPARATVAPATVVASPTTTEEEDRVTAGQRVINQWWEATQAVVVILVTLTTLFVSGWLVLRGEAGDNKVAAFLLLSNAFFAIIQSYLTRTNHTKTGGVGKNEGGR